MRSYLFATLTACGLFVAATATPAARAATLYDTTGGGTHTNGFGPAPMLDDATLAGGGATITAMNFGWHNSSTTAESVDAVVTFWDNMNVDASGSTIVNSSNLGSFTKTIGSVAGSSTGSVGLFNLPTPITVADGNLGVEIDYVFTGTSDPADVDALLSTTLPSVGNTADKFWSDSNDGSFQGSEAVIFNPNNPTLHANFYLRLDGTPLPEPASALGATLTGLLLLKRRRRPTRRAV